MDLRTRVLQSQMPDPDDAPAWINDELHVGKYIIQYYFEQILKHFLF